MLIGFRKKYKTTSERLKINNKNKNCRKKKIN